MFDVVILVARSFQIISPARFVPALLWCALVGGFLSPLAAQPLFAPPEGATASNEILLISTRALGTSCDADRLGRELWCQRLQVGEDAQPSWNEVDWRHVLEPSSTERTIIYVHGNRVRRGEDLSRGMMVYRSLVSHGKPHEPIRFIIWSWPASTIPGPIKDLHVKAARTGPAGWQLAWFLDQLPADVRLSLVGYSYGARVVSGSLHLLGGGRLGPLQLSERVHRERSPIRVAMLAAAFDADWLQPRRYHSRAISQVEQLVLSTNHRDPAMRHYHFSVDRGKVHALGKAGLAQPQTLGAARARILRIDLSTEVGRSHSLEDYLAASGKMRAVWSRINPRELQSASASDSSQVVSR